MLEERANQVGASGAISQLRMDPISQLFAAALGVARGASALGVAPHQFVRIQVRRVPGQEMQGQLALHAIDVIPHAPGLVRRQSIEYQVNRSSAALHHPTQQRHELIAIQCAAVNGEPEAPPCCSPPKRH